ncbi:UNKNOWN [Stylonychia lemnae]|uniref:Uncharacterized protein n=1 Tax=Stylonychia lemnae TaxID=5949 RepID=A0A078APE1_STYLE|nr:UNKNOWN [Stylonychia lemnae]|eukprot:CDW83816.1 UNKNOWN [Stylonychia lemnae]
MSYIDSKFVDYTDCDLDSSIFYRSMDEEENGNKNQFILTRWIIAAYIGVLGLIASLLSICQFNQFVKISSVKKLIRRSARRLRRSARRLLKGKKESKRNKYESNTKFITDKMMGYSSSSGSDISYESSTESGVYKKLAA